MDGRESCAGVKLVPKSQQLHSMYWMEAGGEEVKRVTVDWIVRVPVEIRSTSGSGSRLRA